MPTRVRTTGAPTASGRPNGVREDQPSGDSTGPKATPACTAGLLNFRVKARMDIRAYQIDKTVRRFLTNI